MSAKAKPVAAVILAAGLGRRMNSDLPKVFHEAAGRPLLGHVLDAVHEVGIKRLGVVVSAQNGFFRSFLSGAETFVQKKRLGTGHAVMQAESRFQNWKGDLLVLPGDAPCIQGETLRELVKKHRQHSAAATILTAKVENPKGYGRILRRGNRVVGIREELMPMDLSAKSEKSIPAFMCFIRASFLNGFGKLAGIRRKRNII